MRVWLTVVLTMMLACTDAGPPTFRTVDSAGVTIATSSGPSWTDGSGWTVDSIPLVSIGEIGGDPRYTLDRVLWPQRMTDGRILVPNTRSGILKVYDQTGQYLTEFGGMGEGPAEFSFIGRVAIDPEDTIRVYDVDLNRITVFGPGGQLIRTLRIETTGYYYGVMVGWFANGEFALARTSDRALSSYRGDWQDTLQLEWHAGDGTLIGTGGVWAGIRRFTTPQGRRFVHPFTPRFVTASSPQQAALGDGYGNEIDIVDSAGQLTRIVRWVTPTPELSQAAFRKFERAVEASFPEHQLPVYMRALSESPDKQLTPHYAALMWDALDNLWVRQYDWLRDSNWIGRGYRGTTGEGDWWVFDRDGRWLGTVRLPNRLDLSMIGEDYVLGVHRDTLDVERVRMYSLSRDVDDTE